MKTWLRAFNSMEIHQSFKVRTGIKQGFVLAPTLFAIYFAALLWHAFDGNKIWNLPQNQIRWISFQFEKMEIEMTDDWSVD